MKTPTTTAIATAVRNAEKALKAGYTVKPSASVPGVWFAIKPGHGGRNYYIVDTRAGQEECQCEQWKAEGVCKHQKLVDDEIAIRETEAAMEWAE